MSVWQVTTQSGHSVPSTLLLILGRGLEQMPPLSGLKILLLELKGGLGIGNKGLA